MSCKCGDNPIEVTHFPRDLVHPQTTDLYWGYQHVNKTYKIKIWHNWAKDSGNPDALCDRCVALLDMDLPGAFVDTVFPVVRAYNQEQVAAWYTHTFLEHKLDPDSRFAALLDEC